MQKKGYIGVAMMKNRGKEAISLSVTATGSLEQVILQTNHGGQLAFKPCKWESSITISPVSLTETNPRLVLLCKCNHTHRETDVPASFLMYETMKLYLPSIWWSEFDGFQHQY